MVANVALVILAEIVCVFCGTFIAGALAGFAAAFLHAPHLLGLTGLLDIPSLISLGWFTGRWIARRRPQPTATEIIIGCVLSGSASTALTALAHPAVAAAALVLNAVTSIALYRSAQRMGQNAVMTATRA